MGLRMIVVHVVRLCGSTEELPSGENLPMLPEEMPTECEEDLCAWPAAHHKSNVQVPGWSLDSMTAWLLALTTPDP